MAQAGRKIYVVLGTQDNTIDRDTALEFVNTDTLFGRHWKAVLGQYPYLEFFPINPRTRQLDRSRIVVSPGPDFPTPPPSAARKGAKSYNLGNPEQDSELTSSGQETESEEQVTEYENKDDELGHDSELTEEGSSSNRSYTPDSQASQLGGLDLENDYEDFSEDELLVSQQRDQIVQVVRTPTPPGTLPPSRTPTPPPAAPGRVPLPPPPPPVAHNQVPQQQPPAAAPQPGMQRDLIAERREKRRENKLANLLGHPDGTDRQALIKWHRVLTTIPAAQRHLWAQESAEGELLLAISDGVDGPNTLATVLGNRYLGSDFPHEQHRALMNIKQAEGQTLEAYVTEVKHLARESNLGAAEQPQASAAAAVISGLRNRTLAALVKAEPHATLDLVYALIDSKKNVVDQEAPGSVSFTAALQVHQEEIMDKLQGLLAEQEKKIEQVHAVTRSQTKPSPSTAPTPPPNSRGQRPKLSCFNCGKPGHYSRNCRAPRKQPQGHNFACFRCGDTTHHIKDCPKPPTQQAVKCKRCTQVGHTADKCRAGPPKNDCRVCQEKHWRYDCPKQSLN